jgi:5-(hydroxymethyl)furfural/furfural oxidase
MKTIRARETIVSTGTIHSPALLMKSGVGPADQFAECGVAAVADSPVVGSNLQNHLRASWRGRPPEARHDPAMRRYLLAGARISSRLSNVPEGNIFIAFPVTRQQPCHRQIDWHARRRALRAVLSRHGPARPL